MSSNPLKNTLQRDKLYKIADRIWTVAAWFWSAVIIVFLVSFAAGLAVASDSKNNFNEVVLNWLSKPNPNHVQEIYRVTVLSVLVLFIAVTLLSVILRQLLKPPSSKNKLEELLEQEAKVTEEREAIQKASEKEGFIHYLRSVKKLSQNMSPKALAQYSSTLLFPDVPLDDVFVHLHIIPDRPIFDLPFEQERQLGKIQQHTDLSDEDRENYVRR